MPGHVLLNPPQSRAIVRRFVIASALAGGLWALNTPRRAGAADAVWTSTAALSADWSATASWSNKVPPGAKSTTDNADTAHFDQSSRTPVATINFSGLGGFYYLGAIDNTAQSQQITMSTSSTFGILTLNGATVGGVGNTILRNTLASSDLALSGQSTYKLTLDLSKATSNIEAYDYSSITLNADLGLGGSGSICAVKFNGHSKGLLTLNGQGNFKGGLTVAGGTVLANGTDSAGSGGTVVQSGGTLAGIASGSTGGAVTVQAGGTISAGTGAGAGDKPGILTIAQVDSHNVSTPSGLTLTTGSKLVWKTTSSASTGTAGTTWDRLNLGTLSIVDDGTHTGVVTLDAVLGASGTFVAPKVNTTYTLAHTTNTTALDVAHLFSLNTDGLGLPSSSFSLSFDHVSGGYDLDMTYHAAPEPGTVALILASGVVVLGRRRRKHHRPGLPG